MFEQVERTVGLVNVDQRPVHRHGLALVPDPPPLLVQRQLLLRRRHVLATLLAQHRKSALQIEKVSPSYDVYRLVH